MGKLTLEAAINEISQAFAQLEADKEECKAVVDAALDAYQANSAKIPADLKTEAKNIKKLAKAMMRGEKKGVAEETANMDELLQAIGG